MFIWTLILDFYFGRVIPDVLKPEHLRLTILTHLDSIILLISTIISVNTSLKNFVQYLKNWLGC